MYAYNVDIGIALPLLDDDLGRAIPCDILADVI
jgi:hypothetical protein